MSQSISELLLAWYDVHARQLPWRIPPHLSKSGLKQDPYLTWLSEVMLQQTQIATVKAYYHRFIKQWDTVDKLASADREHVLKAWAGLGYYSRARNLKACAEIVSNEQGGQFPDCKQDLIKLPGVGEYTASAIAAIAFGRAEAVVDGNVERVFTRLFAIKTPIPAAKGKVREAVFAALDPARPGDFAQACMDLGATICTPKKPDCSLCPLKVCCSANNEGNPLDYPVKPSKKNKPVRNGAVFIAQDGSGAVLLVKRPETGLLAGMTGLPTTDWTANKNGETGADAAPFEANWRELGSVKHTFTHFHLLLKIWYANEKQQLEKIGWWEPEASLSHQALPTVFRKALERALSDSSKRKEASQDLFS